MIAQPIVRTARDDRRVVVSAPASYGTRALVERFGRDRTGRRRPVAIVRTGMGSMRGHAAGRHASA